MICSTLSGMMAIKHPTLGVLVREDGSVLNRVKGNTDKYGWTKGWVENDGYSRIQIQGKPYSVHRLVAETFIPNPENKPTVDHINRNRSDNRVCNLRWATYKEQNDNRKCVDISFEKYGVRCCENSTVYHREYRKAHRDEQREYKREYRNVHKNLTGVKQWLTKNANANGLRKCGIRVASFLKCILAISAVRLTG